MTRRWALTVAALAAGVGADLAVDAPVPGITAATGFLGCALIVLVSKQVGRSLLQRPEAYYADPDVEEGLDHG